MESKWAFRRERKHRLISALRSLRIPIMTALGIFVAAFFLIPLAFNGISGPSSMALAADAPPASAAPASPVSPIPSPPNASETAQPGVVPETDMPGETSPAPETGQTADPETDYARLAYGETDRQVQSIQQRLMNLFYMESDEPTDYFGAETEAALKRFQRSHYMKETGVADPLTQAVLFSQSAKPYVLEKGYTGEDVRTLQARLEELGYYSDKLNGYFGTATQRALSVFQTKNGLAADGCADIETRERIYSPNARPAVDPPTPSPARTPKPSPTPTKTPKGSPTAAPTNAQEPTAAPTGGAWGPIGSDAPGGASPTDAPAYTQTPIEPGGNVEAFIAVARDQLGKGYVLGTEGPDTFDCSGLVVYCLRAVGMKVSRYTASGFSQVNSWATVYGKENLRPGDLLFYKSDGSSSAYVTHVAIWLGGNQLLHASTSAGKVCVASWSTWSDNNFLFAKRVF
ncbi:MAG TPA: peptidoglycan-binding protein [Clostridia bacterium]|nr:peptidoglycan-binding protein [Clostridia bacterium]